MANVVEILVKSRGDAKPDVTALTEKLKELGREVETARANVDTAEGAAKLDKLQAQLMDVGKRVENPKISMQGAVRAEAQLHAIEAAFGKITPAAEDASTKAGEALTRVDAGLKRTAAAASSSGDSAGRGFFTRFAAWLVPSKFQLITTGVASGLAALPAAAGAIGAAAGIALGAKLLIGSKQAKGPLYDSFHKMLGGLQKIVQQAAMPLVAPLRKAFGSIGSFARSIGPQLHQVFAALGQFVMPLTRGLEGLIRGVLPGFLALMRAAAPAVRALASLLAGLGRDLGGMFSAFAPAIRASSDVLKMLGNVINGLFPVVGKLAASLAQALGPVLKAFGAAIRSLMPALLIVGKVLGELAGAVLQSLSGALRGVATLVQAAAPGFQALARALGQVFAAMENSGVFGVLEDAIEALAGPLGRLVSVLLTGLAPVLTVMVRAIAQIAAAFGRTLVSAIKAMMPGLMQLARALVQLLKAMTPLIPVYVKLMVQQTRMMTSLIPILPPLLRLVTLLIELATKAITPLIPVISSLVGMMMKINSATAVVIGVIVRAIGIGVQWIASFGRIASGARSLVSRLISWFTSLPGRILSAVGNLGSLLFDAGKNIIQGLLNGIGSMIGSIGSTMGNIVGEIRNFLPFSPAKKGPLSGAGAPDIAGRKIARMLATGITAGMPDVAAAMGGLPGVGGRGGGGFAGRGGIVIEFHAGGNPLSGEFFTQLQKGIRVRGGSPDIVERKVVFR